MKLKRQMTLSVLTAIALTVFLIEANLPTFVPIPGVKLGLANCITLITMVILGRRDGAIVFLLRVVLGSIFAGQIVSFLYSLVGGAVCYLVMCLLLKPLGIKQLWAVSVFGALGHNAGQLLVAVLLTNPGILWYAPVLLVSAILTGAFTGIAAQAVVTKLPEKKREQ
ncbi:MAG: Gx transporter family protein [Oscillospiraceae bacterium]|nr:Gx transporter family protein [Oscillospiraceae bacterium]